MSSDKDIRTFIVGETPNLQMAFQKFQNNKRKECDSFLELKNLSKKSEEQMMQLRLLFVEQAKKYIGVPYHKKYYNPLDADYYAPLFLDCCGLIRRVLRDLEKEFGFSIGPWNQTYMYDTLPIELKSEKDMKPGDLIFVKGIYYNNKMKKQNHDVVHVEIWLGDGTKTIGARWQKGTIQIFDNYNFNATAYHSPVYIYKSIHHWLSGICKSYCPEHTFPKVFKSIPNKKSIFIEKQNRNVNTENNSRPKFKLKGSKNKNSSSQNEMKLIKGCNHNDINVTNVSDDEFIKLNFDKFDKKPSFNIENSRNVDKNNSKINDNTYIQEPLIVYSKTQETVYFSKTKDLSANANELEKTNDEILSHIFNKSNDSNIILHKQNDELHDYKKWKEKNKKKIIIRKRPTFIKKKSSSDSEINRLNEKNFNDSKSSSSIDLSLQNFYRAPFYSYQKNIPVNKNEFSGIYNNDITNSIIQSKKVDSIQNADINAQDKYSKHQKENHLQTCKDLYFKNLIDSLHIDEISNTYNRDKASNIDFQNIKATSGNHANASLKLQMFNDKISSHKNNSVSNIVLEFNEEEINNSRLSSNSSIKTFRKPIFLENRRKSDSSICLNNKPSLISNKKFRSSHELNNSAKQVINSIKCPPPISLPKCMNFNHLKHRDFNKDINNNKASGDTKYNRYVNKICNQSQAEQFNIQRFKLNGDNFYKDFSLQNWQKFKMKHIP